MYEIYSVLESSLVFHRFHVIGLALSRSIDMVPVGGFEDAHCGAPGILFRCFELAQLTGE